MSTDKVTPIDVTKKMPPRSVIEGRAENIQQSVFEVLGFVATVSKVLDAEEIDLDNANFRTHLWRTLEAAVRTLQEIGSSLDPMTLLEPEAQS
jgi:hypothetical protein